MTSFFGSNDRGQVAVVITVVTIAIAAILGVLVFGQVFDSVPASDSTTIENESFSGTFDATSDTFEYTVTEPTDGNYEAYLDDETVRNSTDVVLNESVDYEWYTSNNTIVVENTTSTRSGTTSSTESLNITYTFTEKPTGSYSLLSGFGDAMNLLPVVMIVLVASLVIGVVQRFG